MKEKYDTYDVFTPSQPAELSFVDRDIVNKQLVDSIRTPGKQLVVYGFTGSGKTTLINNKLNQLYAGVIESQCTKGTRIDQLKLEAFDALDKYYVSELTKSKNTESYASLKILYLEIKSASRKQNGEKYERIVPVQLTDKKLAELIGEAKFCWKIEDFHKVGKEDKQRLSQIMKVFMDASKTYKTTKIIAIGALGSGKEVVEYDSEMSERISEVFLPLMSAEELRSIITKGECLLNISFPSDIANKIILYSNGLASICHQLCLSICTNNEIYQTVDSKITFTQSDLELAVGDYINQKSASLKSTLDKIIKSSKRTKFGYKELLKVILNLRKQDFSKHEVWAELKKEIPNYPLNTFTNYLNKLTSTEKEELLRFNKDTQTYYFSNPFQKAYIALIFSREAETKTLELEGVSADELISFIRAKGAVLEDSSDDNSYFD